MNDDDLQRSHYSKDKTHKSCPRCSVRAGRLVFKPISQFGDRDDKGRAYVQSWCAACRTVT